MFNELEGERWIRVWCFVMASAIRAGLSICAQGCGAHSCGDRSGPQWKMTSSDVRGSRNFCHMLIPKMVLLWPSAHLLWYLYWAVHCKVCKNLLKAAYFKCKKTHSSVLHLKSVRVVINGLISLLLILI